MAKVIKMTDEVINELREEFNKTLDTVKLSDGKFTFSKVLGKVDRKADLYFEETAYWKMQALVQTFDKEVAWHGLVRRGDDPEKDEYIVYDILIFPQEVTGVTVNTDQEKYQMWLYEQEDDVFNNIRMQGHSHVNMGVTPSGVDTSLYERILEQLDDDMFYIFLILNKQGKSEVKIYDLAKNILFESGDINIYTLDDGAGLFGFLDNAKKMVQVKPYSQVPAVKNTEKKNDKPAEKSVEKTETKTTGTPAKKKKKKKTGGNYGSNSHNYDYGYGYGYDDYNWNWRESK